MCCCSQTFHNERYLFFTTLWFFQLYDFARRKNFRASKLAELGKEVDIWLALYFRCFSVETALPFFRSDHKFLVHNSSLKKPAFIKEFVKDMVRLFHHWGVLWEGWITEEGNDSPRSILVMIHSNYVLEDKDSVCQSVWRASQWEV